MKNTIKYIAIIAVLFAGVSCHYLDKAPESDGYTEEMVFGDSLFYRDYCEQLVENAPIEHLFNQALPVAPQGSYDCVSDNSVNLAGGNTSPSSLSRVGNYYGMMSQGVCTMNNNTTWTNMWKNVRIANKGIRNIHLFSGGDEERNKILGMCYFFRAYLYMDLCRRWGGMPYMWAPITDGTAELDFTRLSIQQTYKYAATDCDSAAMYLKNTISANEFQHPTRVAALVLKSRCLLYAASDQAYSESGGEGENLWEAAAMAADKAIRAAEDESNGAYGLVDGDNYYYIFKDDQEIHYLKEVLLGRRQAKPWANNSYKNNCGRPPFLDGNFGTAPNQRLVDSYDMAATGLPITDPDSGYDEQNPYAGRDKRFYHDIMYNGSTVMERPVEIWNEDQANNTKGSSGLAYNGNDIRQGNTLTGTYANKWIGNAWNQALNCLWSYIRLSEVYLNFAEAANEAWGNSNAVEGGTKYSAVQALNKVRNRAGLVNLHSKFFAQDGFRERVRNERRVEFCFEEHRVFDVRRWLIGSQPEFRDIKGVYITKLAPGYDTNLYPTGFKYDRIDVYTRTYESYHNLWPINIDDTQIGNDFKQNPGW